jgi:glutamyl-tRNA synthetase/glutamyl-Q tRNA(Asp) synthetase
LKTRFAPSPTGQLHLGHVAAMIHVWGLAARHNAAVHVRIEDHDRQRCRPEYTAELRDVLDGFGFVPMNGGKWSQQSEHDDRFQAALAALREQNLVYTCRCTRKDTETQPSAAGSTERRYPGNCRDLNLPEMEGMPLRVRLPDDAVRFYDARHGWQRQQPAAQCGDPVIRDRLGQWTYQFVVVVDDLHDEIDWVIRGDDLLPSTGRQLLLARLLGRTAPLHFFHHPLIVNPDGTKLSKRDAAAPVGALREQGLSPGEIIGLAACRSGLLPEPVQIRIDELAGLFDRWTMDSIFCNPYIFT